MAEKLSFYNLKTKKKFTTADYKLVKKSGRNFAVADQKGTKCWRIIGAKKKLTKAKVPTVKTKTKIQAKAKIKVKVKTKTKASKK